MYRIYTLGRFQVCLDDKPLQFPVRSQRKPLELLKVLIALGGEQVSEELLCDALWPDAEGDHVHSTLASTLYRLRRLLGPGSVLLRDRRLTLDPEHCWVDARAFEEALGQLGRATGSGDYDVAWAHLQTALGLYRGPFLLGEFEPPEYLSTRERLHGMFLRHIREWGARFSDGNSPERAAVLYQRGLEADPLAEDLYQALMRLHLEQGRLAEGIAVYRRCRDFLESNAGIAPAPETERLYEACLALRDPSSAPVRPLEPPATPEPPPEQPSIAILAFDNLSGDPTQDYLGDGISENLITRLAAIPQLLVIARSSSFAYKGKSVDVRQVGRELGVRHLLEGSVLTSAQRIRVTAQLIDAATGKHLWAEQYDRDPEDFFDVLDEITLQVVTQLEIKLTIGVHARVIARGTNSVRALDHLLRARQLFIRVEPDCNLRARELARLASELDPNFAWALALDGWTHVTDVLFGWSVDRAESLRQAEALARRSLDADPETQFAHSLLSRIQVLRGQTDAALASGQRAIECSPNDPYPISLLAHLLVWVGRPQEGLALIRKALRLQPHADNLQVFIAGDCHYFCGQYEEAILLYRKYLTHQQLGPYALQAWCSLIASLVATGRMDEARAEAHALLEAHPDFTTGEDERLIKRLAFSDLSFLGAHLAGLRAAGVPD